MKEVHNLLGKYVLLCIAVTAVYVMFVVLINPRMQRYELTNTVISEKLQNTDFSSPTKREALITIWQADTNMNKILISVVRYQFAASVLLLSVNCVVLYTINRSMKRAAGGRT